MDYIKALEAEQERIKGTIDRLEDEGMIHYRYGLIAGIEEAIEMFKSLEDNKEK